MPTATETSNVIDALVTYSQEFDAYVFSAPGMNRPEVRDRLKAIGEGIHNTVHGLFTELESKGVNKADIAITFKKKL